MGIAFGEVSGALLGDKLSRFDVFGRVPSYAEECQEVAKRNTVCVS